MPMVDVSSLALRSSLIVRHAVHTSRIGGGFGLLKHAGQACAAAAGGSRAYSSPSRIGVSMSLVQRRAAGVHTQRPLSNGDPSSSDPMKEMMNNPPPSIRSVIVRLLQTLSSKKEVDHYLRHYGGGAPGPDGVPSTQNFAVIKVGGGLIRDELDVLVSSLTFLVDVGLIPVIIHGAGPQLNAKLEAKGIVSEYHGGIRVTTPEILAVAKQTFQEENFKLQEALELRGVRCRGFQSGVFTADLLDEKKFGLVGEVAKVDATLIRSAVAKGVVPVITCAAESASGQVLNVNADVAANKLAQELQPVKVIYLSTNGGLKDEQGKLISLVDVGGGDSLYEELMSRFTRGNRLKLQEIKSLLDNLPLTSSVSITSAEQLPRELFTHKGSGTLVKRTEKINAYRSLDDVDVPRLTHLLESSFGGSLSSDFFEHTRENLAGLYLSEGYSATAIVTKLRPTQPGLEHVAYLDKFAVDPAAQGTGAAQKLWDNITKNHSALIWRSRKENPINHFYCDRSEGCYSPPGQPWTVYWYGLKDLPTAQRAIEVVLAKTPNVKRNAPAAAATPASKTVAGARSLSTLSSRRSMHSWTPATRSFSTSARKRVGIIGARGYTGGELIQLMARHPELELVSANSRAVVGQSVESVVPELSQSKCDWKGLKFVNLAPEQLESVGADLWVMALPNGAAKPYVDALVAANSKLKLIDLSADYRFDSSWVYGLPEVKGNRQLINGAQRVANPGCYATAMQLGLLPFLSLLQPGQAPTAFGVSGYSGAGTTPSRKNDPVALKDNLMPYALGGHIHEREVVSQLRRVAAGIGAQGLMGDLHFVPHVAPWFRGISMTLTLTLREQRTDAELRDILASYYADEPLVSVSPAGAIPEVSSIAGTCGASLAAYASPTAERPGRISVVVTLDNLLKGAASQCMQNINLQLGFEETTGIHKQ